MCVTERLKTKGDRWEHQVCRACESSLQPKQNGHTCTKCQTWGCSAACGRAVVNMHCGRLTGVVSHGSIYGYHSEGTGGSAAEGTPRETQSQEQGCIAGGATTHPTMSDTPDEVVTGQPTQVDLATPRRAVRKPWTPAVFTWSEETCWSWRRHCRRCEPSGTSRGA